LTTRIVQPLAIVFAGAANDYQILRVRLKLFSQFKSV
jgi:hypothetical protein